MAGRRLLFFLGFLVVGCRNTNQELLESELRARDFQLRELKDEFAKTRHVNQALLYENAALRQHMPVSPEHAAQTFGLRRLVLGRLTGSIDKDGLPGDDVLEVHLEPRDSDDHLIKAPGQLQVLALEISPEGLKTAIGSWDIGPEELRRAWRSGLLSTGYVLHLTWQKRPMAETVRVIARLVLSDGRAFEADRDIRVRPTAHMPRPMMPPADVELPLPPPRKLDPHTPEPLTPMHWRKRTVFHINSPTGGCLGCSQSIVFPKSLSARVLIDCMALRTPTRLQEWPPFLPVGQMANYGHFLGNFLPRLQFFA